MKLLSMLRTGAFCALFATGLATQSKAVTLSIDPGATWLGFMNVFNLPSAGGAYQFGSGWGTADLPATFSGPTLTLGVNTIGDPNPYWYTPSGGPGSVGNKIMEANFYQEFNVIYSGTTVEFTGLVLSNTFTSAHTAIAFIKDFAPDYSSSVTVSTPLTPGVFNLSLATINDPARHVQIGFQVTGVNVWVTDTAPFGNATLTAIPEPSTYAALAAGAALLVALRRRSRKS